MCGDFNVIDKQNPGGFRKCNKDDLVKLLAENSTQTQKELAEQLGVMQQIISKRLHKIGTVQKEG